MLRLLPTNPNLCKSVQRSNLIHLHLRSPHSSISKTIPKSPDPQSSPSISYLTGSCGLSVEVAISASKRFRLKSEENHDAVLALLKGHGFTQTQIATLITKHPHILHSDPERTIKPKFEFFLGIGYSIPKLANLISKDPNLLFASLENKLIPNFNCLENLLGSSESAISALASSSRLLRYNLDKMLLPNMKILRDHGVPGPKITMLTVKYPRVLMQSSARFARTAETLKELGFKPSSTMFVIGMNAMSGLTPSTWERKLAVYKSLGWSEKETILAFTKHPSCMLTSEEKIRQAMSFFVNKLQWEPSFLSVRPKFLSLSLEKRIIPRCAILSVLSSKGLVRHNLRPQTILMMTEKNFLENYIMKYLEEVPELLEAYQGKMDFVGLERRRWKLEIGNSSCAKG